MIYAIISLSVAVIILAALLFILLYAVISLRENNDLLMSQHVDYQERIDNMQNIVIRKFDYSLPLSVKYQELEQEKLCRDGK